MSSFANQYDPIEKMIFEGGLRIKAVHFHKDLDLMLIVLNNGKILKHAISSSPLLKKAKNDQLNNYRLIGKGAGIHWPQLDEDLSLKGFLQEALTQVVAA
jgi:hypothetical protein